MTTTTPEPGAPYKPELLVPESGMVMGTTVLGAPGAGKTILLAEHACLNVLKRRPQVLFDPIGTLTPALLFRMSSHLRRYPSPVLHKRYWDRLRVVAVAEGKVGFPIYFRTGTERSVQEVAERLLTVIKLATPALVNAPISGWPALRRIGLHAGTVLASLGEKLDKAEDLLFNTPEWERSGKFQEALTRCPEAHPSVSFFRQRYRTMSPPDKSRLTTSFLDAIAPLTGDPLLQKVFAASTPGIDWQEVEQKGQTVILDFRNVLHDETKRFALLWVFLTLYEFLKRRGRKSFPFVVAIDEFAALTQKVTDGVNPLAVLMSELLTQYCRNHQIWFTCAFQSLYQLDEQLRKTAMNVGNLVVGRTGTMEEARELANLLANKDPFLVKHYREKWEDEKHYVWVKHSRGYTRETKTQTVLKEREPTAYLTLQDQQELYAQKIAHLRLFEFLIRPALREGEVAAEAKPISIAKYAQNPATGEYEFPNQALITKLRARLQAYSNMQAMPDGRQAAPSKKEQDAAVFPPPEEANLSNGAHPVPQEAGAPPLLDDQQVALLAFIIAHPESPISAVYKALGVSAGIGTKLRDSLKAQGLLAELEVRTGRGGAGRPTKLVIPTFASLELLGKTPPPGRGGVIHRYLQQAVAQGARTKGYRARLEYALGNGAIVDVHLEKGAVRIAVEIAVVSTPEREISHIRNCLAVGYDQVFGIFADEALLERTATVLKETFSPEETGKIRLLPHQHLAYLG
jgi:hypothetical protein